jgi:tetratricopeptide (TPR) repeat protein
MTFIQFSIESFNQFKQQFDNLYDFDSNSDFFSPLEDNSIIVPIPSDKESIISYSLDLGGNTLSSSSVFYYAFGLQKQDNLLKAIYLYSKLLNPSFNNTPADIFLSQIYYQRALCYKQLGRLDIALHDAKRADVYSFSLISQYLLLLGQLYVLNGHEELGINILLQGLNKCDCSDIESFLLTFQPTTFTGYRAAANLLISKGKYNLALDYLNNAISLNPSNPYVYNTRSLVYSLLGYKEQSEQDSIYSYFLDKENLSFCQTSLSN